MKTTKEQILKECIICGSEMFNNILTLDAMVFKAMELYAEEVVDDWKQAAVMQRSELLLDFIKWKNDKDKNWLKFIDAKEVDEFLKIKQ